jgi:hypothetical protein
MTVIYDIETLASLFTYTAIDKDTGELFQFVLHKDKFELKALINHLEECKGQVGFNNINFDYVIIHFILENYRDWLDADPQDVIDAIYEKAQEIIDAQDSDTFYKTIAIPTKEWKIQQLDLFKLWHYNNKARRLIAA